MGCGCHSLLGSDLGRGLDPSPENVLLFDFKIEHFCAVFKLDLTEETRTQLQEEAIASFYFIQATPMLVTTTAAATVVAVRDAFGSKNGR